jgi:hypothetical protein
VDRHLEFIAVILIARLIADPFSRRYFWFLDDAKRTRCSDYVLELIVTTAVLFVPSMNNYWELVFYPDRFRADRMLPADALHLARGLQSIPMLVVALI